MKIVGYIKETIERSNVKWTISRPEHRNSLGTTIGLELHEKLCQLEKLQPNPRTLTITTQQVNSKDKPIWVAGGDLKELSLLDKQQGGDYASLWSSICQKLEALPAIVIASIHGGAIGGGAELALACDIRIATNAAYFDFKQLKVGLATGYGGTRRLVDLVGLGMAQKWLLLSKKVTAHEATTTGLIHQTFATADKLAAATSEIAKNLADIGCEPLQAQKKMLQKANPQKNSSYAAELKIFQSIWMNPKHQAFLHEFNNRK